MDVPQLEALIAIAEAGTFEVAAQRLCLTPSALSHRIKGLERECGDALLIRGRTRVRPTPSGARAIAAGRRVLAELSELKSYFSSDLPGISGQLRIGSTALGFAYIYWEFCKLLMETYPGIELILNDLGSPADVIQEVRSGGLDVGLTALPLPPNFTDMQDIPFVNVEWVIVVGQAHPLAAEGTLNARQLAGFRFFHLHAAANRRLIPEALSAGGAHAWNFVDTNDVEYIKRAVILGRGVSMLPWPTVEREVEMGQLVALRLQNGSIYQQAGLVLKQGGTGRLVRVIADFCRTLPVRSMFARAV